MSKTSPPRRGLYYLLVAEYRHRKDEITKAEVVAFASAIEAVPKATPLGRPQPKWEITAMTPEEHRGGPGFCWACAPYTPLNAFPVFIERGGKYFANPELTKVEL